MVWLQATWCIEVTWISVRLTTERRTQVQTDKDKGLDRRQFIMRSLGAVGGLAVLSAPFVTVLNRTRASSSVDADEANRARQEGAGPGAW